jgi:peptide/nickel transport system permease protein
MTATTPASAGLAPAKERTRGNASIILRRALRTTRGRIGAGLLLLVVLIAVLGPLLAAHQPGEIVTTTFAHPSGAAPLGGDGLGRDVLTRVLNGGRVLLALAAIATLIGLAVGVSAGLVAAYAGGWAETVIMRVVDVTLAIPQIIFALLLLSVVGPKTWLLVLAVGLSHAPQVARVVFAASQDVTERDYVRISRLWGVSMVRVLRCDVLPNLLGPLMVELGLRLSYSIVMMAGLSFLGFGRQPPAADWGLMINENRVGLETNPWAVLAPALLIAFFAVAANTLGDAIARAGLGDPSGRETAAVTGGPQAVNGR